jgi:hypothetical protein
MTNSSWRTGIADRFPDLFTDPARGHAFRSGIPECGDGWRDLVERAVLRIAAAAPDGGVTIEQIKSKYATARIYYGTTAAVGPDARAAIEEAIALAEARSACTCETCGREGFLYQAGGWLLTACLEHARGEPVPVPPAYENLHVTRSATAGWPNAVTTCRRYVRPSDSFVDVDPSSVGLEK